MKAGMFIAVAALGLLSVAHAKSPAGAAAAAGPTPTTFVVKFKIKPGRNADFEKVMKKLQGQLAASEPGNIYYDLYLTAPDSRPMC
jgi:hypothetical protein